MGMYIQPGRISGEIRAIPSKSQAHRLLICAALAQDDSRIAMSSAGDDILRTAHALHALCARVVADREGYWVSPREPSPRAELSVGESGSSYRFLLPVAAALDVKADFVLEGRLPERPMEELFVVLQEKGARIAGRGTARVSVSGKLRGGRMDVKGGQSSQFVTGLLLAAPLTGEDCQLHLTQPLVSRDYVGITIKAMRRFGVRVEQHDEDFFVPGGQRYQSPGVVRVEGDWSNAAFWLCAAAACGGELTVKGLRADSPQGDKAVVGILRGFGAQVDEGPQGVRIAGGALQGMDVDIGETPDLAPAVALLGLAARGETHIKNISRLRLKESDRAASITLALQFLGADILLEEDSILIRGGKSLPGGETYSAHDHRIAMMAACAAVLCEEPVFLHGTEAVSKSYPGFFKDLRELGIQAEEVD